MMYHHKRSSHLKSTGTVFFLYCIGIAATLFPYGHLFGASLHLAWNPNRETDLGGYRIYFRTESGSFGNPLDVGKVTSYELSGLEEGMLYSVALTAYDLSFNESEKCPEVSGIATASSNTSSTTTTIGDSVAELENGIPDQGLVTEDQEDHYYIDIPSDQTYLVIELAGNPDADLYVRYGSPPSLALWDCRGYTAQSSEEQCLFTNPDSGRWYIMIRGYAGRVTYEITARYGSGSPPSTTTTVTPTSTIPANDTTPPSGRVTINNGLAVTYSTNVILTVSAEDAGAELKKNGLMTFSNDNQTWSEPEPYTTSKLWRISPEEGTKTVYAKFSDPSGNWMITPASDQIIYQASDDACQEPHKLRASAQLASSQFLPFFAKENAVDGSPSTTWSTLFSIFKKDEFITLDLGELKKISWFSMHSASTLFGTDYFPVNFRLEVSKDNMLWEEISSEQGYAPPLNAFRADSWDFESVVCRYIRVYITKAKSIFFFFKVAQIAEIEVYGCGSIAGGLDTLAQGEPQSLQGNNLKASEPKRAVEQSESGYAVKPGIPGKPAVTFLE